MSFVLKRLLLALPTALGVVTLTFAFIHLTPGDPVDILLGEHALPTDREALRQSLGLHLPLWQQYMSFLAELVQGNLGASLYSQKDVASLIAARLPATIQLAFAAMLFAIGLGIPLGVWSAVNYKKWPDKAAQGIALAGLAMPSFWLGPLLIIVFSVWLGFFPVSGKEGVLSIILPAITLGFVMAAMISRLLRASLLDILGADYIRTARAKGLSDRVVYWRHAFKNALLPVITVVFLQLGNLMTGAILTEAVFAWPGVGSLIVEALHQRDYPVVQGCVLFIAFTYMLMTLLSDIIVAFIDPRIRYGDAK